MENVDISVCMLTYYHENYIRKAIDSVLSQKTTFSYEIVISDDCSKDKTLEILDEYVSKYPNIIRVNKNATNLGIPNNIFIARCLCKGKYIVGLSGDDYWIDDYKLEKQASFLEKNPEYFAACVRMELRYDDELIAYSILPKKKECNRDFTIQDYEKGKILYTHGLMMRNLFLEGEGREYFRQAQKLSDKVDDAVDNVLMLRQGKFYVMDEITDVYRAPRNKVQQNNYNSRYSTFEKTKHAINLYNNLYEKFGKEINFKGRYIKTFSLSILRMLIGGKWTDYISLYHTIPEEYRKPIYSSVAIQSIPKSLSYAIEYCLKKILKK